MKQFDLSGVVARHPAIFAPSRKLLSSLFHNQDTSWFELAPCTTSRLICNDRPSSPHASVTKDFVASCSYTLEKRWTLL